MAGRIVVLNKKTGRVDYIRSSDLEVLRDGDFFVFLFKGNIQGRDGDIIQALKLMKNRDLRRRVRNAFLARDLSLHDLRQKFHGYTVKDTKPEPRKGCVFYKEP